MTGSLALPDQPADLVRLACDKCGRAASREQAMADFKTAWERKSVIVRRT